jgi:hypothetical protein
MGQTLINVITIKNIVKQVVPIPVQARNDSPITTFSGTFQLQAGATFEAEDDRFDISQLRQMANINLINYEKNRRLVTTEDGTSTGSGSA